MTQRIHSSIIRSGGVLRLAMALLLAGSSVWAEQAHHQGGTASVRSGQIFGQPWEEAKGLFRWRSFVSYLDSSSKFDDSGDKSDLENNGRFRNASLNLFGEYALTDRLSGSLFVPVQRSELKNDLGSDTWTSLGDVYVWGRYRFADWKTLSPSVLGGVKIPGNYKTVSGVGDGQADYEAQGFLTRPLAGRHYLAVNSGYRYRVGSVSDEIIYGVQVGVKPSDPWLLIPALNGVKGVGDGVQKDFLNVGMTVYRTIKAPWSALASFNHIHSGKNTVSADVWSLGVSYR